MCKSKRRKTRVKKMTKREYVEALAKVYYMANNSDTENRASWQNVDDCLTHCGAIDAIVRDMGLSEIWGNIIEGDLTDEDLT